MASSRLDSGAGLINRGAGAKSSVWILMAVGSRQLLQRQLDAVANADVGWQYLQRRGGVLLAVTQRDQGLQDVGLGVVGDRGRQRQIGAQLALELQQQPLGRLLA